MTYTVTTNLERKGNGIKVENAIAFFRSLEKTKVSSGIHKEAGGKIIKRASRTEFGSPVFGSWMTPFGIVNQVPPRPAIRMSLYPEMKEEITDTYSKNINKQKKHKLKAPYDSALGVQKEVGIKAQYLQQNKMIEGGYSWEGNTTGNDPEHNGVRTIVYKGFDDPWIQTGETLAHVDYKISANLKR